MALPQPQVSQTKQLVAQLLDRNYSEAVAQTLAGIARNGQTGGVAARLAQLDAEAARLAEAGERLTADNPVYRALVADFEIALRRDAALVDLAAEPLQESAGGAAGVLVRQLALPGLTDENLTSLGIAWNQPDPEAVAALLNTANSPAWAAELSKYQSGVVDVVNRIALQGMQAGWGPLRAAREIRRTVQTLPAAQANTLMRTLQLKSYRQASVVHRLANEDILEEQIRIAALDNRCCLACLALHGKHYPIDVEIVDHHNGRCDSISTVRGRPREVQSGETWLAAQPEDRQRAIMGEAAWQAWKAGDVRLQDFVHEYHDPVFGQMVRESTLRSLGIDRRPAGGGSGVRAGEPAAAPPAQPRSRVADALTLPGGGLRDGAERGLALIDRVHGDGGLPPLGVTTMQSQSRYGGYTSRGADPVGMELSTPLLGKDPTRLAETIIHETGHFIDHQRLGASGDFGSAQAAGGSGPMASWWNAVAATPEYQTWRTRVADPAARRFLLPGGEIGVMERSVAAYHADPREVWARSYVQYIATRSGDSELQAFLATERNDRAFGVKYWDEANFAPVADEMDRLFESIGWKP